MATTKYVRNTKKSNKQHMGTISLRSGLTAFMAAFMGVAVGMVASLAVVVPMVQSDFAAQAKQLDDKLVSMTPASDTLDSCAQTTPSTSTSSAPAAQVSEASAPTPSSTSTPPPSGGAGGASPLVSQLIGGQLAKTTASISDTGPQSSNTITTTNTNTTTVTNTNDISAVNVTSQTGSSGNATTSDNTTGGSATSGDTTNSNSSMMSFDLNN